MSTPLAIFMSNYAAQGVIPRGAIVRDSAFLQLLLRFPPPFAARTRSQAGAQAESSCLVGQERDPALRALRLQPAAWKARTSCVDRSPAQAGNVTS